MSTAPSTDLGPAPAAVALPDRPGPDLARRLLGRPMPTDRLAAWVGTLAVTAFAAVLRFDRLGFPRGRVFDEVYYSCDSHNLLLFGVEHATKSNSNCVLSAGPGYVVHPPLGKWMIGFGEWLFGFNSYGWRFSAAVVGTLAVLLFSRTVRRLTRSTLLGLFAGLLMALDGLEFVQSRVSMLDIFVYIWIVAALACLVCDRDWCRARLAERVGPGSAVLTGPGPRLGWRPWRWATGFCLGAACACKWSGMFDVFVCVALVLLWDAGARRTAGVRRWLWATLRRDVPITFVSYVVLGAVVYTVSWTGWFLGNANTAWDHDLYTRPGQGTVAHALAVLHGWFKYASDVWHFHETLVTPHPYQSHPIGWLLLARPVSFYYESPHLGQQGCHAAAGCSQEILDIGTPAIWWLSIAALVVTLWLWAARRDWRATMVLVGVGLNIVPWMWSDVHRRTEFFFYALPALPFLILALTLTAGMLLGRDGLTGRRRSWGAVAVGGYALVVLANFVYLYPILTAQTIPYWFWSQHMWFPSWV